MWPPARGVAKVGGLLYRDIAVQLAQRRARLRGDAGRALDAEAIVVGQGGSVVLVVDNLPARRDARARASGVWRVSRRAGRTVLKGTYEPVTRVRCADWTPFLRLGRRWPPG